MSVSTFANAFSAAPDLINTPSLAIAAAGADDPTAAAQGLAHLNTTVAVQSAIQNQQNQPEEHHAWWQSAVHAVFGNKIVSPVLGALSKPLQVVQHEYRYLHDVYAHRNIFAAIGETLAMAGAFAAGTFAGGPIVGTLAAEGVGALEGQVFYRNEWKRSADEKISPGRDVANLLGQVPGLHTLQNTDAGAGKLVSGLTDTAFDFSADPLIKLGGLNALRKTGEGLNATRNYRVLGHDIAVKQSSTNAFMQKVLRAPGLNANSPERVDAAWKAYGSYRTAAKHIATLNAGDIVTHYGPEMSPLSEDLAAAKTADAVHDVFRMSAFRTQMSNQARTGLLPTRTVMRVTASKLLDRMAGDVARADERPVLFGRQNYVKDVTDEKGQLVEQQNASRFQLGIAFRPDLWVKSDAWKAVASRKIRTFSGYAPYAIDDATGELSSTTLDLSNDTNLQGLLRTARFALGEKTARKWVDDFTQLRDENGRPHLGLRRQAYGELLPEILKAAGMVNDPDAVAYLTKWSRHVATPGFHTTAYGFGHRLGDDVNMVVGDETTERYGMHSFQPDTNVTLPNFRALKSAMRNSSQYTKWYGKLDDFAAHYYTNNFFKPLALLTLGFGLRVAASEAIPATFRYGAWNMLTSGVAASAAKMRYALTEGEAGQIIAAASKAVGGVDKLLNNAERRELATRLVIANEGHIARGVASAGHSSYALPDDPTQRHEALIDQSIKRQRFRTPTGDFRQFLPEDPDYVDALLYGVKRRAKEYNVQHTAADYKAHLDRGFSEDSAAQYATEREAQRIRGIDPNTGRAYAEGEDPYAVERTQLVRYNKQRPETFAAHRVDDMINYVTGRDGTLHDSILQKFIDGDNHFTAQELRNIPLEQRPKGVSGEVLEFHLGNVYQRVVSDGFKRLIDPVINHLSREPIYFNEFASQYKALKPLVESGKMTDDAAFTLAQIRATRAVIPQIHNTALRSQFAILATNFMPFYFAQEQALKRAGHLIRRNPAAFRKYQLVSQGLHDPAFVQPDGFGGRHVVFPLVGEYGAAAMGWMSHVPLVGNYVQAGLPLTVEGNVESLSSVLPDLAMPKSSPFAAIALSKIAAIDPAMMPIANKVLGDQGFNEELIKALIPNTAIRSAVLAMKASDSDTVYSNAVMTAMQAAYYHGQMPDPATATPHEIQKFIQRIRNNARSVLMVKALFAEVSPLSPSVSNADKGFREEFTQLLDKMPYDQALHKFLHEHGDKAISYTIAKTQTDTGAYVPYTTDVFNYLSSHEDLLAKHPWGAAFSAPTGGHSQDSNSLSTYNELLRTGLSERRTPEQFFDAIHSAVGVQEYVQAKKAFDAKLAEVAGTEAASTEPARFDGSTSSSSPSTSAEAALRSAFDEWKTVDFQLANPIAYDHLFGKESETQAYRAYQDIVQMFNENAAPATEQASKLLTLVQGYEATRAKLAQMGDGTGDRSLGSQRQDVRDAWSSYLDQVAQQDPTMSSVVTSVFARLDT